MSSVKEIGDFEIGSGNFILWTARSTSPRENATLLTNPSIDVIFSFFFRLNLDTGGRECFYYVSQLPIFNITVMRSVEVELSSQAYKLQVEFLESNKIYSVVL